MSPVITLHEYDVLVPDTLSGAHAYNAVAVPAEVYAWLEVQALQLDDGPASPWVRRCRRGLQLTSYVGVLCGPGGVQLEVLPKIAKAIDGGHQGARALLVDMLSCLPDFKHLHAGRAKLGAARMPLLDLFIAEFLQAAAIVVRTGLRGQYAQRQDNLPVLRGKLMVAHQLRYNLVRPDRFHTAHDDFTTDRPENRLICNALHKVLRVGRSGDNQRLARELAFAFADVPPSVDPSRDVQLVQLDRNMRAYGEALAWAQLIIQSLAPTPFSGVQKAPSLLFPMEGLFEAYVAKHLHEQLPAALTVRRQVKQHHLVHHEGERWFQLKPDLVVLRNGSTLMVLDTKWKLIDGSQRDGTNKYNLSQSDFYQLQAYGQSYLGGNGELALVYPRTDALNAPLPVFNFAGNTNLSLWVLPFCLKQRRLLLPPEGIDALGGNPPALSSGL